MDEIRDVGGDRARLLLLACARTRATPDEFARIRALATPPFDWSRLASLADTHGVWALVFARATEAAAPVPDDLAVELGRRLVETTALNLSVTAQLANVLSALENHGVSAIALKGPILAGPAYGICSPATPLSRPVSSGDR